MWDDVTMIILKTGGFPPQETYTKIFMSEIVWNLRHASYEYCTKEWEISKQAWLL